jgi:3-keto-5-aminohexanoate cleavage enzyme
MRKVIINAAVVGTRPTKEMNPAVPYTPKEIAEAIIECCRAGAAATHIHVRDPKTGSPEVKPPELQVELYREVMDRIREKCNIILNLSLSKVGLSGPNVNEQRLRPASLKPDVASIHGEADFIDISTKRLREYGVKPEVEAFNIEDIRRAKKFVEKGAFDKPFLFNFCLGTDRGLDATPENLLLMKNELPEGAVWSVMIMDKAPFPLMSMAMVLGGNARVGFEDYLYIKEGVLAKSNAQLVEKVVDLIHHLGYEVATPDEARVILGLKRKG